MDPMICQMFHKIQALNAEYNDRPSESPGPYSSDRCGFVMGESAAVVVIEEMNQALARGAPIYAEIVGTGHTSDAFHLTRAQDGGVGL